MTITTSLIVQPGNPECQDRAEVISSGERTVLILAGGANGISGGAQAAELCVRLLREAADQIKTTEDCVALLTRVDEKLARRKECGETTGIIVIIRLQRHLAAWLFASDGNGELTRGQQRKPLFGSGGVMPRGFNWDTEDGTIVVASDGLWNYTSIDAIRSRVQTRDSTDLALRLAELARLPSGTFPDDVAVITCRIALMESSFKIGDKIRVRQVPPSVDQEMPPDTVELFHRCVGQVMRIDNIDEYGHLELNVTSERKQAPDYCQHTIWIEPEFVVAAD